MSILLAVIDRLTSTINGAIRWGQEAPVIGPVPNPWLAMYEAYGYVPPNVPTDVVAAEQPTTIGRTLAHLAYAVNGEFSRDPFSDAERVELRPELPKDRRVAWEVVVWAGDVMTTAVSWSKDLANAMARVAMEEAW